MRINLTGVAPLTVYEARHEGHKVAGKLTSKTYPDAFLITEPERYDGPPLSEGDVIELYHEQLGVIGEIEYQADATVEFDAKSAGARAKIKQLEESLE